MPVTVQELARIFEVYKAPFEYDDNGTQIFDNDLRHVIDIRGWSHLQKLPDGIQVQDSLGRLIAEFLNNTHMVYLMDKKKKEDESKIQTQEDNREVQEG